MNDVIACGRCGSLHPSHVCVDLETTGEKESQMVIKILEKSGIKNIRFWRGKRLIKEWKK